MKCARCEDKERRIRDWCASCYQSLYRAGAIECRINYRPPYRGSILYRKPKVDSRRIGRPRKRDERFISFLVSVIVGR